MVFEITKEAFGEEPLATKIAANTAPFFGNPVYPNAAWEPE